MYRIKDAPPTLRNRRNVEYPNLRARVTHAHRRAYPELDSPPNHGCSSKLSHGPLIAHNRWALEDTRPYGSRDPGILYGSIYQYWRRTSRHPSFPGYDHNIVPATGHYPDDQYSCLGMENTLPAILEILLACYVIIQETTTDLSHHHLHIPRSYRHCRGPDASTHRFPG